MPVIFIFISVIILTTSCQNRQNNKPEIRFVDLKGNSRAIEIKKFSPNVVDQQHKDQFATRSAAIAENQSNVQNSSNAEYGNKINSSTRVLEKNNQPENLYNQASDQITNLSQNPKIVQNNPKLSVQNSQEELQNAGKENLFAAKGGGEEVDLTGEVGGKNSDILQDSLISSQDQESGLEALEVKEENKKNQEKSDSANLFFVDKNKAKIGKEPSKIPVVLATKSANSQKLRYYLQVGSFSSEKNAISTVEKLSEYGRGKVEIARIGERKIYRSLVGPFVSKIQASNIANQIKENGQEAIIVKGK